MNMSYEGALDIIERIDDYLQKTEELVTIMEIAHKIEHHPELVKKCINTLIKINRVIVRDGKVAGIDSYAAFLSVWKFK